MEIRLGKYRHFKGKEYEVIGVATHSETLEELVVYRALYGEGGIWVRPASMWDEEVEKDELVSRLFEKYGDREDVTHEELEALYEQIGELKAAGSLFAPDTFRDKAGDLKKKTSGVVKALCLHIAHTCNLDCSYCFASQGKYHGERALMSLEVGKRALDFLIENSGTRRNLEVDFFGGEPLMNFEVVKELVAYARTREKECGKNFRFTLTTNGMLIDDDVIEFANREC